jgi:iron complex outermembrane receptor protein
MNHTKSLFSGTAAAVLASLAYSTTVKAQAEGSGVEVSEAGIEEVTVTARRREEDLQSVPISISAFTADDLRFRDIFNLERLAEQTPGLSFATAGSVVNRRPVIRGFAQQTRVGDEPNVATFIDGVYTPGFSGSEFFGFESLERIEVLKGPQSALYGRNSFAGAINYVTAKPRYEFEYGGQATLGQDDREGASAFVSGPLIDDTLAMRFDAGYNETGGTNENSRNGEQLGNTKTNFARLGTRFDVSERLRFTLSLSYQDDEASPTPITVVADDDPRRVGTRLIVSPFEFAAGGGSQIGRLYDGAIRVTSDRYSVDTRAFDGDREIWRGAFTFELDFDEFQLVGTTGYQDREVETLGDFNTCRRDVRAAVCDTVSPTAIGTFFGGPLANAPIVGSVLTGSVEDRDEFSQDLRLQSTGDGRLQWSAGLYFSTEDFRDQNQRLSDVSLTSPAGDIIYAIPSTSPVVDSTTDFQNDFYSVYGSLGYDISSNWSFLVEARLTREEKEANQKSNNFPTNVPPTGKDDEDFDFFTPRFILNFTPTDDLLVYGSVAKGVKSGGFNAGSIEFPTYDEEENWTYELGSKYTFLDGKARINGAVYYVDWDDQQVTAVDPDNTRLPITINVAETEIWGGEIDALYAPADWVQFNVGAAYIDAEYKEGTSTSIEALTDCENLNIPCDDQITPGLAITSGDLSGQNVVGTPEKTFNAGVQVNWPFFQTRWGFRGRLDYSWQDKIYIDEANQGYVPARETVNLRLGIEDGNWSIDGFCNNLTDDDTPLFALPPRDILGVPHYAVVNRDERLCGMQVAYRN